MVMISKTGRRGRSSLHFQVAGFLFSVVLTSADRLWDKSNWQCGTTLQTARRSVARPTQESDY